MAKEFTSWQDLYTEMLNRLTEFITTGNFHVVSYGIAGRNLTYRSLDDLKEGLEWVKMMADIEQGRAVGRTYARPVGRFNA